MDTTVTDNSTQINIDIHVFVYKPEIKLNNKQELEEEKKQKPEEEKK